MPVLSVSHLTKSYAPERKGLFANLFSKSSAPTTVGADNGDTSATHISGVRPAIKNINLEVQAGDIFAFIGPNGAGKTTTIKAIVGIHPFEAGTITINGHSIKTDALAAKRCFSYLPDNPDLYEYLKAIDYRSFIAAIYQVYRTHAKKIASQYAAAFEITSKLDNKISSFSHGMKQKLAIVAALLHEPQLLILDEPFVGLDPQATLNFKEIMHDMCRKGAALWYSTHVLEVAEKLCNKAAIIKQGVIIMPGTMQEITQGAALESAFMKEIGYTPRSATKKIDEADTNDADGGTDYDSTATDTDYNNYSSSIEEER